MRKINNPYKGTEGYNCFGCSPDNEHGLQMHFVEDGDYLVSEWEPRSFLQGYVNILHGGIQATLMDEIASWLVQIKLKTAGVTSELKVRYLKPVPVNKGAITLRAGLSGMRRNLADIHVELFCPDGNLCAVADVTYFTFPQKVAAERLHFPEYEKFFDNTGE
jgi:uncharacterized protein (TIGR00369 family)